MAQKPNPKKMIYDRDSGYAELITTYRTSKEKAVFVGFLQSSGVYKPKEKGKSSSPITLAQIGAIHEFGSSDGKHPPMRSFMGTPMDTHRSQIEKRIKVLLGEIVDRKLTETGALGRLGEFLQSMFRGAINAGLKPRLAASTMKRKDPSKFKPLIDTGQLIGSIRFEVRGAKGGPK
jgi:hypothetical protein